MRVTERYARDLTVHDWNLFKQELDSWLMEVGHHSNLKYLYENEHYKYLEENAAYYLPFFFLSISVRPIFVYTLLAKTFGLIPYDAKKHAGNVPVMNNCWLRYGLDEGFIEFEQVDSQEKRDEIMNAPLYFMDYPLPQSN